MNHRFLLIIITILAAVCAAEAYYIYKQRSMGGIDPAGLESAKHQQDWLAQARKSTAGGATIPFENFDDLFDDDFFRRRLDPFAEIEDFQKRMAPFFSEDQKHLFDDSWGNWLKSRIDMTGIRTEIQTTEKEVVLSLEIPGLKGETLSVNVNGERIRIAYDVDTVYEEKGGEGRPPLRTETLRHFQKILPIPAGADPEKYRVAREGQTLKIIFERKPLGIGDKK